MTILNKLFFLVFISVMAACSSQNSDIGQVQYIISAEVVNRQNAEVLVDNFAKEIIIGLLQSESKDGVRIRFILAEGVSMVDPSSAEAEFDLGNDASIVLSSKGQEIKFRITSKTLIPETDPVLQGWTEADEFGSLPEGIKVYKSPSLLAAKNAKAFIAVADLSKGKNFHVLGETTGSKTPRQFYDSSEKSFPIILNAGYFWSGSSLSMICRNGIIEGPNLQVVTRSDGSSNTQFYPTRGVFSHISNDVFRTDWVFSTVSPGTTFAYPNPAPNKSGTSPMPVPSSSYPSGSWVFGSQTAIGGGPVLVKAGQYRNTWEAELFDLASGVGPESNNPRSAIGFTHDKKLVLFVCEGRNKTPGIAGLTLQDVALIMLDLGCVEVLNLDGGGSSCMLVNGIETIVPSDGSQRSVATAVGFK